jgi:hypothetical protein
MEIWHSLMRGSWNAQLNGPRDVDLRDSKKAFWLAPYCRSVSGSVQSVPHAACTADTGAVQHVHALSLAAGRWILRATSSRGVTCRCQQPVLTLLSGSATHGTPPPPPATHRTSVPAAQRTHRVSSPTRFSYRCCWGFWSSTMWRCRCVSAFRRFERSYSYMQSQAVQENELLAHGQRQNSKDPNPFLPDPCQFGIHCTSIASGHRRSRSGCCQQFTWIPQTNGPAALTAVFPY